MPLDLTRYRLNNIQRWMMDEKRIMATRLNGVEWSYLSPPDSHFVTCQIKEKLSVGEMRQISGWRWLSVGIRHHFRKPFSLLLSYTPYDLSNWLSVCVAGLGSLNPRLILIQLVLCLLLLLKVNSLFGLIFISFLFIFYSFQSCPQWLPTHVQITWIYDSNKPFSFIAEFVSTT